MTPAVSITCSSFNLTHHAKGNHCCCWLRYSRSETHLYTRLNFIIDKLSTRIAFDKYVGVHYTEKDARRAKVVGIVEFIYMSLCEWSTNLRELDIYFLPFVLYVIIFLKYMNVYLFRLNSFSRVSRCLPSSGFIQSFEKLSSFATDLVLNLKFRQTKQFVKFTK